jgi:predicted DNA-binding ribbon-helix-helix protein
LDVFERARASLRAQAADLCRESLMKSGITKRSIVIDAHKTSVSLEDAFWGALKEIARQRGVTLSQLVATIDHQRQHGNLSSAIRLFVLSHYRPEGTALKPVAGMGTRIVAA